MHGARVTLRIDGGCVSRTAWTKIVSECVSFLPVSILSNIAPIAPIAPLAPTFRPLSRTHALPKQAAPHGAAAGPSTVP